MAGELKLLSVWSSPFALRVVHALKIKGLEYQTVMEDLNNKSDLLLQYNPVYKKIPVLVHNAKPICESLLILEYIDETWKHPCPLLPQDPYKKARARFWAKFGDDKVVPVIWTICISQGKEQDEAIARVARDTKLIEELLKGTKLFGGETIGYLDIAFGWMANMISILEEMLDLVLVDGDTFPLLSAWINDFAEEPIIKGCWPPRDKLVEKFKATRQLYLQEV